ncbi:Serine/threonine-protein kinase PknB [Allorhodopirellula solitaria]|uniref:Serine/threonine-protein kinase PknB n=2 Tax=Allorhodopirellula solitaria TaxID=2527987 RepID=A0A5C5XVI6_9BACT|nr:Serine/threonine-protein kinase PknB [Allorhodopirellula solitaria]
MKYIAGGSLQQRLDRDGPLEVCEVLRIGMHAAKGLAAAHSQGLIHREVKPSNILLDEGVERALLTDFGLARATDDASLTRSGFHPGTPHYMSPEQVRGEAIDGRSDLFGLGCVLYAMCTGHPPFRSETSYAVLRRITDDTPRGIRESNSDIPAWLESTVLKLLSKTPDQRFESAGGVFGESFQFRDIIIRKLFGLHEIEQQCASGSHEMSCRSESKQNRDVEHAGLPTHRDLCRDSKCRSIRIFSSPETLVLTDRGQFSRLVKPCLE